MIEQTAEEIRGQLEIIGNHLLAEQKSAKDVTYDVKEGEDRGEVVANLMLAYRHIEDARMRLGKVYQARNGGISNSTK